MKSVLERMKANFDAARQEESGDIVQTILVIAVMVVAVVVVGKLIYDAVRGRAVSTSNCIVNANPANGTVSGTTPNC